MKPLYPQTLLFLNKKIKPKNMDIEFVIQLLIDLIKNMMEAMT